MVKTTEKPIKQGVSRAARLSVAPMMDWTDRHCRYLHRLLSHEALLYTEMVTSPALVRGGAMHLLDYSPQEHPVALQLGGSDPAELAKAARFGADVGYDEINLNVGCPSDRVQSGTFGAVLMRQPDLVADCVKAMQDAVEAEVTVKCRIGVDDQDPAQVLPDFLETVSAAGCRRFTIHARKAWLQGLSPKENRDIPPLDYDRVKRLKERYPDLFIGLNGGLQTLDDAEIHLEDLDGVMFGRAAYHTPQILGEVDRRIYGEETEDVSPWQAVRAYLPYIEDQLSKDVRLAHMTRHMLGLFHGRPGARSWRRILTVEVTKPGAGTEIVEKALAAVSPVDECEGLSSRQADHAA